MADENKERKKIKIASVGTSRKAGQSQIIQFKGDDGVVYEAWGEELAAVLKVDEELDCEVLHTTRIYQGQEETIHRVQQIYINGQPVRPQRRAGGGGGRSYGKTDEQISVERISIEGQTAYNGIIALLKEKILTKEDKEAKTALEYAELKMRGSMKPTPAPKAAPATVETKPPAREKEEPVGEKEPKEAKETKSPPITEEMIKHISDEAKKKGYTQETLEPLVMLFGIQEAKELTVAQGKELLKKIENGEGLPTKEPLV